MLSHITADMMDRSERLQVEKKTGLAFDESFGSR